MLSLARWSHQCLSFGFKVPLQYLTLSWFSTKNVFMLQLTILVVLNCIMFWIEPFAYKVCCTWLHQVLDRTFCYQSLTVRNCIRFWIELCYQSLALLNGIRSWVDPLLLEECKKFSSPLAYASGQSHSTYFTTVKPAYLSRDTAWICLGSKTRCLLWPRSNRTRTILLGSTCYYNGNPFLDLPYPLPQQWSASGGFDWW